MRQLQIRKDLDDYLSKRKEEIKESGLFKGVFQRKKFPEEHLTISTHKIKELECSDDGCVVVVNDEPNFFKVVHDKIMKLFKKKD